MSCRCLCLWISVLLLAGCNQQHYRRSADKETAAVIAEKGPQVPNMDPKFTIETNAIVSLSGLPRNTAVAEFLGADASREDGVPIVSLQKALEIAVKYSRTYQSRKEDVYLSALALTLARHKFTPIFSASGSGNYIVTTEKAVNYIPNPVDPSQQLPVLSDRLVEQHQVHGSGVIGTEWLIRDIGKITAAFTTDFVRVLSNDPRTVSSSQLGATFTRPLLRDAGFKTDIEILTQAERDTLYDLRDFTKFRKDFSVQVASAYYGVLGNRDAIRNSYLNLQSSRRAAERSRALAQEGRATQSDLGRLEQQALSTEATWINAVRSYKRALDDFKILLGVPVVTRLMLDDSELTQLRIQHPELTPEDAIKIALAARLDFQNVRDQRADADRKVKLAADRFKPRLDLVSNITIDSGERTRGFALPDPKKYTWSAGANIDPGFDKKAERNEFRAALITMGRAERAVTLQQDNIELQVRESLRTLDQAKRTYEISEIGVKLAERRVEEQEMLAELGRAKAQDQVDAQNDLVNSKNQRTQAMVAHTIARLQFWDNLGILYIKENGQWQETYGAKPNQP